MLDWMDYAQDDVTYTIESDALTDASSVNAVSVNQYTFATGAEEAPLV